MSNLPRDVFIDIIFDLAKKDKDIYFLSADLGAKALDRFRQELPSQFIHCGISEQNMIDVAAGLSQCGKKVYVYAMAPFVTYRCYEQIKVVIASMNLPVTIIGVGAGYSYDDAGPTHYAIEDISCMRVIPNIEILNPSDEKSTIQAAKVTYEKPKFRYIRIDRKYLPDIYINKNPLDGISEIEKSKDIAILTNGYMFQKAIIVKEKLAKEGINLGLVDIFTIKPLNKEKLKEIAINYNKLIVLEEHFLDGGLGSCVLETLADLEILIPVLRIGIVDKYIFDNGGREYIHKLSGIDINTIIEKIKKFYYKDKE
ncbi:transketolase family protein [Malaciobacter mytili]|uniref:transketolase family protein n=1 Tax=Malaciobacter mytili TaxID=603050 RepID=UPI003A889DCB